MEYSGLFSYVSMLGEELGSRYRNNKADKRAVVEFMDANGWFGMEHPVMNKTFHMTNKDLSSVRERLALWLSAFRKPDTEKAALLLDYFNDMYPETCRLYAHFMSGSEMSDTPSSWKLLDFLFSEIDKEITEYSESDMETLIGRLNNGATRKAAKLFAEFLNTKKRNGETLSCWRYDFGVRDTPAVANAAYPFEDFACMAHCIFNEEMWERNGLIWKAVQNKTYADTWLFVALHFVCALRASDMKRIPAPALPYDGETVLRKIVGGTFSKKEATALVADLHTRLELKPLYPSKTESHDKVSEIKLFVPESLAAPFGCILAIALAHNPGIGAGDVFVRPASKLNNLRAFFGEDFKTALGGNGFSTRRCNKSYMQGIELVGDDEPGKPKGYMLAALARSHKSKIGKLSEITDAYLKDARFSGYSPEFIIRQMFERGVFGFIPAVLLEMYAGAEYIKLPIPGQTRLIGEVGLAAYQIEGLAEVVERALIKSRKAVGAVMQNRPAIAENIGDMLQNIASGAAPGRQKGYLCLMMAAGLPCPFAGRDGCIGCGYEIYTKTAMYTLIREYVRLADAIDGAEPADARRYGLILEQAVMPAVKEVLESAKLLYPDADISGLTDIMEVELGGADSVERKG
jgi:hypothetical protein